MRSDRGEGCGEAGRHPVLGCSADPSDLLRSGLVAVRIRSGPLGDNDLAVVLRVRLQAGGPLRTLCAQVRFV